MKVALAVAGVLLATSSALAQAPAPAPAAPPPCASAERHQFDFWVGRWDVYPTAAPAKLVAHSLIESVYNGCGIRENWMPLNGGDGGSLSSYVPKDKGWRQTWIGSGGERVEFTGGWNGSAMVLTGEWPRSGPKGEDGLVRMTYTRGADGSVRQLGEVSIDGGKTWGPSFDFTYRPSNLKTPLATP